MTDVVDPGLSKAEDMFKSLVWDGAVDGVLTYLFGSALKVPILGSIIRTIVTAITDKLYGGLRIGVDLAAVSFLNDAHKRAFDNAEVTLKIIAHDKGIESEEYKNARQNAKDALARFVRYNGAGV